MEGPDRVGSSAGVLAGAFGPVPAVIPDAGDSLDADPVTEPPGPLLGLVAVALGDEVAELEVGLV